MKKVLLSLLLIGSVSSLFAQNSTPPPIPGCPKEIKSNQGGGQGKCPDLILDGDTLVSTALVTLTFENTVVCAPDLVSLKDKETGEVLTFLIAIEGTVQKAPNDNVVEYCLYSDAPSDNFFNQPDLIATLDYTDCKDGGFYGKVSCDEQGQAPLPVKMRSFTAARNKANVAVKWITSTETNNKGFNVQRNTRGIWETVAFVPSQANLGNSTSDISYSYTDANNHKGVTQYRIQQVDIDGRTSLSEIRSVQGEAQVGRTVVYPNPSNEGSVNLVFDATAGSRDVIVSDISGRVIKSWRGIKESTLKITNLMPGTYMLRIVNDNNGQSSFEKVVVNK